MEDWKKPIIIIEHCEGELTPWLVLEYRSSSIIYGREYILFTNVPERYHKLLSKYGKARKERVVELIKARELLPDEIIVLDPRAKKELTYRDLVEAKYIVIGGILGDHPPKGRTWELITSKMPESVRAFNIGEGQYSIDGTIYYVNYLWEHGNTIGYKYIDGVVVKTENWEVYLPFRYPLVNNKPLLADGLEYYLVHRKIRDDIWRELVECE